MSTYVIHVVVKIHLAHFLDHFWEFLMLPKQEHELSRMTASPLRNSQDTWLSQRNNTVKLLLIHGVHQTQKLLYSVCRFLFLSLRNHIGIEAGNHADNLIEGTHIQHRGKLVPHIPQCELPFLNLFHNVFLLGLSHRFIYFGHQATYITQTQ